MASIISAGTTSGTALNMAGDTSGQLQLATNGSTTAVTIDTSQRVGIGTASPSVPLAVYKASDSAINIQNSTSGVTNVDGLQLLLSGSTGYIWNYESGPNIFGTDNTERMRITSTGNVGIGTGAPAYKLSVNSSNGINSYDGVAGKGRFVLGDPEDATGYVGMYRSAASTIGTAGNDLTIGCFSVIAFTTGGTSFSTQTERMRIDSSGGLILAGSTAQKASGTTWSNPSDQRLKDNIRDYTKGTTELMQVRVREWEYNGKGGTTEGLKGLGVVADEVMTVLPNTVETYDAKLNADDEETTAIKKFDATEITWLLVKTVQEQQTIINDLKARITALEGAA
jgi:hypothetical protein